MVTGIIRALRVGVMGDNRISMGMSNACRVNTTKEKTVAVLTQLFVWILTVAISLALGVVSMGVFFGSGSLTWIIALSVVIVSFVGASESDDCVDESVMAALTR